MIIFPGHVGDENQEIKEQTTTIRVNYLKHYPTIVKKFWMIL
jgi:hypothetical protein